MCKGRTPLPQLSHVLSLLNNILINLTGHTAVFENKEAKKSCDLSPAFKWKTELDCSNITFKRSISIAVFPSVDCGAIPQKRKKQMDLVYMEASLRMFLLKRINSIPNNTEHISYTDMTTDSKGKSQQI